MHLRRIGLKIDGIYFTACDLRIKFELWIALVNDNRVTQHRTFNWTITGVEWKFQCLCCVHQHNLFTSKEQIFISVIIDRAISISDIRYCQTWLCAECNCLAYFLKSINCNCITGICSETITKILITFSTQIERKSGYLSAL